MSWQNPVVQRHDFCCVPESPDSITSLISPLATLATSRIRSVIVGSRIGFRPASLKIRGLVFGDRHRRRYKAN
jgi:hypothetical protein